MAQLESHAANEITEILLTAGSFLFCRVIKEL